MKEHNSKILLMEVPLRISRLFEAQRTTYSIVTANSIDSALKLIEEENIKLCVLSDNFSGMEFFIREVRNTPLASELPLLVITSSRTHEELFKMGADAFFATTESDAKFLEKIELLLGLGDSNRSNVFVKRAESENPFYFVLQYAAQMAEGFGSITPAEHARSIPDDQSLYSLIQAAEKDSNESERHPAVAVYTEGLEAVEPQGYIDHQLSVGERMETSRRESGNEFNFRDQPLVPGEEQAVLYNVHSAQRSSVPASAPAGPEDSDLIDTNVLEASLKHGGESRQQPLSGGNTLSQPFSVPREPSFSQRGEAMIAHVQKENEGNTDASGTQHDSAAVFEPSDSSQSHEMHESRESHESIESPESPESTESTESIESIDSKTDSVGAADAGMSHVETDPAYRFEKKGGILSSSAIPEAFEAGDEVQTQKASHRVPSGGRVEKYPVWKIFVEIMATNFSGTLKISRQEVTRQFFIDKGELMVVSSNAKEDRLVELLYREGRISERQYESASMIIAASGRRAGVVMVDKGILSPRELFPVVRYHYESILHDTFSWLEGEWLTFEGEYTLNERIVMDTPLPSLILDAFRSFVPAVQINQIVRDTNPKIQNDIAADMPGRIALADVEREMLKWCDGTRSIAWISRRLNMEKQDLKALLAGLMVINVLQPPTTAELNETTEDDLKSSSQDEPAISSGSNIDRGYETGDLSLLDEKLAHINEGTYFDIAEVSADASALEIRQSLQRLKSLYSPERFGDIRVSEKNQKLELIGAILAETTDVLLNDEIRERYRKAVQRMASGN